MRALNANLRSAQGWYRKGAALMSLARYEEAAMAFRKGVEIEPQNDDLKSKLADAERQAKYAPKRFKEDGVSSPLTFNIHHDGGLLFRCCRCALLCSPTDPLSYVVRHVRAIAMNSHPFPLQSWPKRRVMLCSAMPSTSRPSRSMAGM